MDGISRHFSQCDWKYLGLLVPSLTACIASDSDYTLETIASLLEHCSQLGGTEFLMKTPLLDAALVIFRSSGKLPDDFKTWAPPGPGCRMALFTLRPRGQRRNASNESMQAMAYAHAHSVHGCAFRKELLEFHERLMAAVGEELNELVGRYCQRIPEDR